MHLTPKNLSSVRSMVFSAPRMFRDYSGMAHNYFHEDASFNRWSLYVIATR